MLAQLSGYLGFAFAALKAHLMTRPRAHAVFWIVLVVIILFSLFAPPLGFPSGTQIEIPKDQSFGQTAASLAENHVIISAKWLKILARVTGADNDIQAGTYAFATPEGTAVILYRLANGITEVPMARVTFPEGSTVKDMGETLATTIPGFDEKTFVAQATPDEGYLFPDTYDFPYDVTPDEVIARLHTRFDNVWVKIEADAVAAPTNTTVEKESQERIVTMASLLEKETKPGQDRRIVSGILWHRIAIGMALQVDAVFGYIRGVDTYAPTAKDLELDSPYNTYKNRDLPPGPIGNPGEDALRAALMPLPSDYLYYLTGADGKEYYAQTFDEHKANKEKYLK